MESGNFIINNLEYFVVAASPLVVYGVFRLKKIKIRNNDLSRHIIQLNKQKEALNNKSKGSIF